MGKVNFKLSGIIPPMVTPLTPEQVIDQDSTCQLVDYLISGGVHALFILGSNGEGPLLTMEMQKEFAGIVVNQVRGRIPVIVGVSDSSTRKILDNIENLTSTGINAVVSTLPLYDSTGEKEQLNHFQILADQSPLPVIIYDIPARVGTGVYPSVLFKLADHNNLIGLKDSSGDIRKFRQITEEFTENRKFSLIIGHSDMIDISIYLGADGVVPSDAHLDSELCVRIYKDAKEGRFIDARKRQMELNKKHREIYTRYPDFKGVSRRICKRFLQEKGIITSDIVMDPYF